MIILGIETSCDETAAAVVEKTADGIFVLSNVVSSQIEIHQKYGGVVPEVAAREHVLNIIPVINEALGYNANTANDMQILRIANFANRAKPDIDAIAVTVGPGLITSLQTGVETAKTLAFAWGLPVVAVNHIEGHIAANFIGGNTKSQETKTKQFQNSKNKITNPELSVQYPIVVLTVSGGHTMLVLMEKMGRYKTIGETRDDAAGEAFDKAAKLMDIGYPGGPRISAEAEKFLISNFQFLNNNPTSSPKQHLFEQEEFIQKIVLPRPMIKDDNLDFSFSGLKTAVRYKLEKDPNWKKRIPEYCFEIQEAIVDTLAAKTLKAARQFGAKTVMLAGGVAANERLRERLRKECEDKNLGFRMPELRFTTDNAAMIAAAGALKAERGEYTAWKDLKAECNLGLTTDTF